MYSRFVDKIAQTDPSLLSIYEYQSWLKAIQVVEEELTEDQLLRLESFKKSKPEPIPVPNDIPKIQKSHQKKWLFQRPNLLQEKRSEFKYQPKQGELFNRAKKSNGSEKELQDHLSGILAEQAQQLLENTKLFNEKITQDTSNLSEMEYRLENINLRVKSARDSMKLVGSRTWTTTIMIWASILGVVLILAWMILFMKFF